MEDNWAGMEIMDNNSSIASQFDKKENSTATRSGDLSGSIIPTLTKTVIEHDKEIGKQSEDIEKLNVIVNKFKEDVDGIKLGLENKIEDSKIRIIETLGIFVALFTFISIDFQVFKSYSNPFAISGLILILLGSLMMFVWLLDYLIFSGRRKINIELILINLAILFMGFFLFIISSK